jgi:hypothetical protein
VRALWIFLISFVVIAVGGAALVMVMAAGGDFDPVAHFEFHGMATMFVGFIAYFIATIPLAILAASHRKVGEWAAGYAGTVLGIVPYWVLQVWLNATTCGSGYLCSEPDLGHDLVMPVVWGVLVAAAPVAGLVYLVVGGIFAALRPSAPRAVGPGLG